MAVGLVVWRNRYERLSWAHTSALTQFFDPVVPGPLEDIQKTSLFQEYFCQHFWIKCFWVTLGPEICVSYLIGT